MKKRLLKTYLFIILALTFGVFFNISRVSAAASTMIRPIFFPTETSVTFKDDFSTDGSARVHHGNDLIGKKMMPLYSAIDGRVKYLTIPEADYGYYIIMEDSQGYTYHYIHVNNDNPGTDDDLGGVEHAYAPGITVGARVTKGQLVGWMGDSGNAEGIASHLHFEIHLPDDTAIDPYPSLIAALHSNTYSVADALALSPNINTDKGLTVASDTLPCVSGSRTKLADSSSVYYCGADGQRYVFPNDKVYFTWYKDFTGVTTITAEQMAAMPIGGNVTYRPGVKLIKIQTDPKVYAVEKNGTLRWVPSGEVATALYGSTWSKKVDDVSDVFFMNYTVGQPISGAR